MLKEIMQNADTPLKRIGLLMLTVGIACLIFGFMHKSVFQSYPYRIDRVFTESVTLQDYYSSFSFFVFIGFYLSIIGAFFSVLYDKTIGKIVNWVRRGS